MKIPHLTQLLGDAVIFRPRTAQGVTAAVGWGLRKTTRKARQWATRQGVPFWTLEEGFLKGFGMSAKQKTASLILDKSGIYYDAHQPSDLEQRLVTGGYTPETQAVARQAMTALLAARVHKFGMGLPCPTLATTKPILLVVDQVAHDQSIAGGLASPDTFARMAQAAHAMRHTHQVVVKVHPAVAAGQKKGMLRREWLPEALWLTDPVDPMALLPQVAHVMVVTSQMGFDALLHGKTVECFGAPFYSNWGLTCDHIKVARRSVTRSLEDVFYAAYFQYSRYIDPVSGAPTTLDAILRYFSRQSSYALPCPNESAFVGFQFWKQYVIRAFSGDYWKKGRFVSTPDKVRGTDRQVFVWGSRFSSEVARWVQEGKSVTYLEDGFLRSVGLGSDLVPPKSLVFDRAGIYYDARTRCDLERLLEGLELTKAERLRAQQVRSLIARHRLSKYNFPLTDRQVALRDLKARAGDRKIILVPGQVADDASLRYGAPKHTSFAELIGEVRAGNPQAFIIYRPHPDVMAGNRQGETTLALGLADQVELSLSSLDCLEIAEEVHVLTSLVGFEALLRDIPVVTYGQPFYAGWGLTCDQHLTRARLRHTDLDTLVFACLIAYPRYYSWGAGGFISVEEAIAELVEERDSGKVVRVGRPSYLGRKWRKLTLLWKGWRLL